MDTVPYNIALYNIVPYNIALYKIVPYKNVRSCKIVPCNIDLVILFLEILPPVIMVLVKIIPFNIVPCNIVS